MKVKRLILAIILILSFALAACGKDAEPYGEKVMLNFINHEGTKLETREYYLRSDQDDITASVEEILYEL
ncbi:MAG: hypothetical protein J5811_03705, partial [Lachnospiraceae bacterium]|nr:hypothetical protein [Lachnospiraceae bacterium]